MASIEINYDLPHISFGKRSLEEGDLEESLRIIEKIKSGQQILKKNYTSVKLRIVPEDHASYHIYFDGKKDILAEATSQFIKCAGIPNFINAGDRNGNKIINQILKDHGKTTKRKFFGWAYGKYVVDKN